MWVRCGTFIYIFALSHSLLISLWPGDLHVLYPVDSDSKYTNSLSLSRIYSLFASLCFVQPARTRTLIGSRLQRFAWKLISSLLSYSCDSILLYIYLWITFNEFMFAFNYSSFLRAAGVVVAITIHHFHFDWDVCHATLYWNWLCLIFLTNTHISHTRDYE